MLFSNVLFSFTFSSSEFSSKANSVSCAENSLIKIIEKTIKAEKIPIIIKNNTIEITLSFISSFII